MSNPDKRSDQKGLILIAGAIAVLAMILVIGLRPSVELGDDLCPVDEKKMTDRIAIIIDPTDTLNTRQSSDAVSEVLRLIESAPQFAEISLHEVHSSDNTSFRICKPAHHDSIGFFEQLYVNQDFVERDYTENFKDPLLVKLEDLLTETGSSESPIIRTIQTISIDAFGSFNGVGQRQVIIVSDMVQHSDDWSFFRDPLDFDALSRHQNYRTMKSRHLGKENNQGKAIITVLLLARRGQAGFIQQKNNFMDFWKEYFIDQGAENLSWEYITG